ncbi:TIGR04372 family glycosyltransferase [Catenovulum sediminis]|uniref:TIGR04372 family glycosyltransferase n=1 Tax=Catenovulum sediminis TaxID=1740262 RepID=UPI0011804E19|nr:TIGR04372 family glycosyltransferase [Catenovulum sediminis]
MHLCLSKILDKCTNELSKKNYIDLLKTVDKALKLDPNNAQLLKFRLDALLGLGTAYDDLGFLRKLSWYRSTDPEVLYHLAQAFWLREQYHCSVVILCFMVSVGGEAQILNARLRELGYSRVKIYFINTQRIGHLACESDAWLRKRARLQASPNELNIFIGQEKVCNYAYLDMLANYQKIELSDYLFNLHSSRPLLLNDKFYGQMPYDVNSAKRQAFSIENQLHNAVVVYKQADRLLELTEKQTELKNSIYNEFGIHAKRPIVCLHVRDSKYLTSVVGGKDTTYHDYRDVDILNYESTIRWLIGAGYTVVRIGQYTNQKLSIDSDFYIDLNQRNESSNVSLAELIFIRDCVFYLGINSGPFAIAASFDKPCLLVNCAPYVHVYGKNIWNIFKKLIDDEGKAKSFVEIAQGTTLKNNLGIEERVLDIYNGQVLAGYGYSYIENTSSEIIQATIEFEGVLSNRNQYDDRLLRQYFAQIPNDCGYLNKNIVIPHSFLQANKKLFNVE